MAIHHSTSILIVDDSGAVRSVVRKLLTQLGFSNLDEASDGEAALAKISDGYFGLVISDWNMEPMSGNVLLEQVRANKQHANLPFIMMTADLGNIFPSSSHQFLGAPVVGSTEVCGKLPTVLGKLSILGNCFHAHRLRPPG